MDFLTGLVGYLLGDQALQLVSHQSQPPRITAAQILINELTFEDSRLAWLPRDIVMYVVMPYTQRRTYVGCGYCRALYDDMAANPTNYVYVEDKDRGSFTVMHPNEIHQSMGQSILENPIVGPIIIRNAHGPHAYLESGPLPTKPHYRHEHAQRKLSSLPRNSTAMIVEAGIRNAFACQLDLSPTLREWYVMLVIPAMVDSFDKEWTRHLHRMDAVGAAPLCASCDNPPPLDALDQIDSDADERQSMWMPARPRHVWQAGNSVPMFAVLQRSHPGKSVMIKTTNSGEHFACRYRIVGLDSRGTIVWRAYARDHDPRLRILALDMWVDARGDIVVIEFATDQFGCGHIYQRVFS